MPFALAASVRFGPVCRPWTAFTVGLPLVSHQYRVSDTEYETDRHQTDALRHNTANVKRQYNTRMYRPGARAGHRVTESVTRLTMNGA